jgi:hypothetical protein
MKSPLLPRAEFLADAGWRFGVEGRSGQIGGIWANSVFNKYGVNMEYLSVGFLELSAVCFKWRRVLADSVRL